MSNADETFTYFAGILKANKKDDCPYTGGMIDELCADFARLSMLWDGAFSLASKVKTSEPDITN